MQPLRDLFAAVFFISVGLTVDPVARGPHWLPVVVLDGGGAGRQGRRCRPRSFLAGNRRRAPSVRAGMSLAQIGEFSFIIAGLGIARGACPKASIYAVAVAISLLTLAHHPVMVRNPSGSPRRSTRRPPARRADLRHLLRGVDRGSSRPPAARSPPGSGSVAPSVLLGVDAGSTR